MKPNKFLTIVLCITVLLTGQLYAALLHSETSSTKYLAATYDFVPISIGYTLTPSYIYDENGSNRVIRNMSGSTQVNSNQSYLDTTEMIALNFNSSMYGTPLDVNSSSSTYAYTQKDFSPYLSVTSTLLTPVARFTFNEGVVPAYAGSEDFSISWPTRQSANQLDYLTNIDYRLIQNAYDAGQKVSSLVNDGSIVAYVNGEPITKNELETAILNYDFSIKENSALGFERNLGFDITDSQAVLEHVLEQLIVDKVILFHVKTTGFDISSVSTFDYSSIYQQLIESNDEAGIRSLRYVLDCLNSYAQGQNMSIDEYLSSISTKISERNAIASWKESILEDKNITLEETITLLRQNASVTLIK